MSETRTVRLGDVAQWGSGGTPKRSVPEYFGGEIPWLSIADLTDGFVYSSKEKITLAGLENSSAKLVPEGAILIAMYGSIGKLGIAGTKLTTSQAIAFAIPNESLILPSYLFYKLLELRPYLISLGRGGTQQNISQAILKDIEIELPDFEEQQRFVKIRDLQSSISKKREHQQALFEELQKSIFIETFGNPITNSKNLPLIKLGDLGTLDRGVSKHRPRNAPELLGGPYPLIQTGDVANSGGFITSYTSTYSELGLQQSKIWPAGTLCITIAANIAKTGILTFDACFPDSVVGFTSTPEKTLYVKFMLDFLQEILEASAPQSAQKNINLNILRNLEIPSPELEDLIEFSTKIKSIQQ